MEKPLVSVIIPTYNSLDFLIETISSVLVNDPLMYEVEVIVVDDCSSDNTFQIISDRFSDIKIIRNEKNLGVAASRNIGIKKSNGAFIAFCDADDLWEKDKLELQLKLFENSRVGMVCSDANSFDIDGIIEESLSRLRPLKRGNVLKSVLHSNFIVTSSVLVRKDIFYSEIGFFDASISYSSDFDMWIRILRKWELDFSPQLLVHYRVLKNSISSNKEKVFSSKCEILESFCGKYLSDKEKGTILYNFHFQNAMHYFSVREMKPFRLCMKQALVNRPYSLVGLVFFLSSFLPSKLIEIVAKVKGMINRKK